MTSNMANSITTKICTAIFLIALSFSAAGERKPPQEAINACEGKRVEAPCEFQDRQRITRGVCNDRPGVMACAPNRNMQGRSRPLKRQTNTQNKAIDLQTSLPGNGATQFKLEAWADNWFIAYLGSQVIIEDSVSVTTERSFNSETIIFDADYPLQLNFVLKDFIQNNTGLEYIGQRRQQIGDGGFIMQLTDMSSGKIVSVSDESLKCTVIHKAPLNKSCVRSSSPVAGLSPCKFVSLKQPAGWKTPEYDDSNWKNASTYSRQSVRPKDGYYQINWDNNAKFIWGPDLETDNTILCRVTIGGEN
ncbi:MAG: PEBP family protein [Gammaproteobacteria bacterium]|nr:PEBP family protein [Gammaproteobacteria bacterium]